MPIAGIDSCRTNGERVVYRAHRDSRAHESWAGARPQVRVSCAALHRKRGRAAQSRSRLVGSGCPRSADPRQLVADGNRRHHDRQLRQYGHSPGLHGPTAAGHRSIHRQDRRARTRRSRQRAERRRRASAARPGWPSMFRGYLGHGPERYAKCFAGGWYLTGDLAKRDADGYFWFVGRAGRRDQVGRSSDRSVRSRKRVDGTSGGGRGGRDRQARSGRRAKCQSLRVAAVPGTKPPRRCVLRTARPRPHATRRRRGAEGDRSSSPCFPNSQRQDHAAAAQGPRAGLAGRGYLHA